MYLSLQDKDDQEQNVTIILVSTICYKKLPSNVPLSLKQSEEENGYKTMFDVVETKSECSRLPLLFYNNHKMSENLYSHLQINSNPVFYFTAFSTVASKWKPNLNHNRRRQENLDNVDSNNNNLGIWDKQGVMFFCRSNSPKTNYCKQVDHKVNVTNSSQS